MRTSWIWIVAVAALGCGSAGLERAERRAQATDEVYTFSESDVASMRALAVEMDAQVRAARENWLTADVGFNEAARRYDSASEQYSAASRSYDSATARFRLVTTLIIMAAASDLFLRGACGPNVSRARFRLELREQGVDLDGKDIDHIIAHARGGPDRPWNYNPLESSINRSIQEGGLGWKLANYPLATLNAMAKFASSQLVCPAS